MRKFITKVQELGKKAAEIQQAIHTAPAKAAEIREALTMSANELQQLRTDVQSNVNGLRANSEDRILQAMRDVNDNTYTFEEAGYELTGMDLDLTLSQRLAVHLQKFEDVAHAKLRELLNSESNETIKAILAGLLKAEESAANVELTHLKYDGVVVHIGALPLIRMSWRSETLQDPTLITPPAPGTSLMPSSPPSGSFFEQRSIPPSQTVVATQPPPEPSKVHSAASISVEQPVPSGSVSVSPWAASALDRFKKMPNLSKHRSS